MTNSSFPERLRQMRIEHGLSQTDLAVMANIAPGQINRYESGKNTPRPHVMSKLAGVLGVLPDWLATGNGPQHSGVLAAYSNPVDVEVRERAGGMDISLGMDEGLFRFIEAEARQAGLSIEDFLMELMLERIRLKKNAPPAESGLDEIAKRLTALEEKTNELVKGAKNNS